MSSSRAFCSSFFFYSSFEIFLTFFLAIFLVLDFYSACSSFLLRYWAYSSASSYSSASLCWSSRSVRSSSLNFLCFFFLLCFSSCETSVKAWCLNSFFSSAVKLLNFSSSSFACSSCLFLSSASFFFWAAALALEPSGSWDAQNSIFCFS